VVVTTYYAKNFPIAYNSCTGSASHGPYSGFTETIPATPKSMIDYWLQNQVPKCTFRNISGCIYRMPNEWMTFKIWIKTGTRNRVTHEFDNSEFKLWVAREGQPSKLVIWWRPGIPGYFPLTSGEAGDPDQSFGKVTLTPFITGNSAALDHPLVQTWYDDLIISREDIPDPAAQVTTASALPKWRGGKAVGRWFEIPNTANMSGVIPLEWAGTIDAWGGLAAGPTSWWSAASSGHREWWNPVVKIELANDAPKWTLVHASSPQSAVTRDAYYADGLPTARHTYRRTQYINASNASDGVDRVMLFGAFGAYAIDYSTQGAYGGGPKVDGFRVKDAKWDPAGTWPDTPWDTTLPSVAKDPRTDDVYYSSDYTTARWTAKTNTWTVLEGRPGYGEKGMDAWNHMPSLVDVKRNKLVGLIDGHPYRRVGIVRLQRVDLATNAIDEIRVTGDLAKVDAAGRAMTHDLDNDRYLYFSAGTVYAINPDTGASTIVDHVPAPKASEEDRAAYFPALGGVAYLPTFSSNILFLPTR
jgi:hypothetical protein